MRLNITSIKIKKKHKQISIGWESLISILICWPAEAALTFSLGLEQGGATTRKPFEIYYKTATREARRQQLISMLMPSMNAIFIRRET